MFSFLSILLILISGLEARPFCNSIVRQCQSVCSLFTSNQCLLNCVCNNPQITALVSTQECKVTLRNALNDCETNRCIRNTFCDSLPARCCNPNERPTTCVESKQICCDGTWECPNAAGEYSCDDPLGEECCCEPSLSPICPQGARRCCPNDGQYVCASNFPPTEYKCSDGNTYTEGFAQECNEAECCEAQQQPGRFGNDECAGGNNPICCADGTWLCGGGTATCAQQSQACTCPPIDFCTQQLVCCDGVVYNNPCYAAAACYTGEAYAQYCTSSFISDGTRSCTPSGGL